MLTLSNTRQNIRGSIKDGVTHHGIILSRADFISFNLNFKFIKMPRGIYSVAVRNMSLVEKDHRKEIVMEQFSQRYIGKARNNDRSERAIKVDGAEELIISIEPSPRT